MSKTEQLIAKYLDVESLTYVDDSHLITELRRLATLNEAYWAEVQAFRAVMRVDEVPSGYTLVWVSSIQLHGEQVNQIRNATDAARREAGEV